MAGKYRVRDYVKSRGLEEILISLYGVWTNEDSILKDFDNLPDEFVIKSNNGCGNNIIISEEKGGINN